MFDLPLINPSVFYVGAALVSVPLIIHLINMMRHRRIEWAAMEFLLESKKKNSTYIFLKQLLLLLCRMAAVLLLALILGQLVLKNSLLGGAGTHHVIVLQDDLSTSEAGTDNKNTLQAGKEVIEEVGRLAASQTGHRVTLLRTSNNEAVFSSTPADQQFPARLEEELQAIQPTALRASPLESLTRVRQLIGEETGDEQRVIYLVSDFRDQDVRQGGDLAEALRELQGENTEIVLVRTAQQRRANLAITGMKSQTSTPVTDRPIRVEVEVSNFSPDVARNVSVTIVEDGQERPIKKVIDSIPQGGSVKFTFDSRFSTAGPHHLQAKLPGDALLGDNVRHLIVECTREVPVLLIDDAPDRKESALVAGVMDLRPLLNTGLAPEIKSSTFLSDPSTDLSRYKAVFLFNLKNLLPPVVDKLEEFAKQGGGVCFFVGHQDTNDVTFYNAQLYNQGEGLFPAPLSKRQQFIGDRINPQPDLKRTDHPLFSKQFSMQRPPLESLKIYTYWLVQPGWTPPPDSSVVVVLELQNGHPFILEKRFGQGRVLALLTGIGRPGTRDAGFNSWQTNPSFVLTILDLCEHIISKTAADRSRQVGDEISETVSQLGYNQQVELIPPGASRAGPPTDAIGDEASKTWNIVFPTDAAGVYTVRLTRLDGSLEQRKYAFNVDPAESQLRVADQSTIEASLPQLEYTLQDAGSFSQTSGEAAKRNYSEAFLYIMIGLLLLEQFLAYLFSYHPSSSSKGGPQ